ncbi:hypothetical protein F5Y17DRAFT_409314 [Xylariaceae sp. FL0594]|nr:hypothetical protein F5Y17DRAFT_409314 [Xylariaceae sp. FL0594]
MGRPPAYIFVVRHGNRLDAADKQWHLTSPTPYDPPLTYGGWVHSRTVGTRIASILRDEALADLSAGSSSNSSSSSTSSSSQKRRRFRVVIHSSPFLRCVQTSIAISAGLAAPDPTLTARPSWVSQATYSPAASDSGLSGISTLTTASSPSNISPDLPKRLDKAVLRLDAFLGEWLSPEYFEHITPPPKSALMLATAKAELLRRSSYDDYPHYHHSLVHSNPSTHLWNGASHLNKALLSPQPHVSHHSSLESMAHIVESLPGNESDPSKSSTQHIPGYVCPVPSYAISPTEPIPRGYVAHARDACVAIDYQWDSSRDDLAWGDGGVLPEEWPSMHQRFRKGLRHLVDWYSATENPGDLVAQERRALRSSEAECAIEDNDEEDVDHVVVLVSHGAGCNALVGGITQQPVLADVPMSSLTMAKRRAAFDYPSITFSRRDFSEFAPPRDTTSPPSVPAMPEMYELKLFANTDHLVRPTPLATHRPVSPSRPELLRSRFDSDYTSAIKDLGFGSIYGNRMGSGRPSSTNASLGSIRKKSGGPSSSSSTAIGSRVNSFSPTRPDRSGSGTWGLWSPRSRVEDTLKDIEKLSVLLEMSNGEVDVNEAEKAGEGDVSVHPAELRNSNRPGETADGQSHRADDTAKEQVQDDHHGEEHDHFDLHSASRPWAGTGKGGLWGRPIPPGEAERLRDFTASKRRWTVTER